MNRISWEAELQSAYSRRTLLHGVGELILPFRHEGTWRNFAENCSSLSVVGESVDSSCITLPVMRQPVKHDGLSWASITYTALSFLYKKNNRVITFAIGSCARASSHTTHRDHRHTSLIPRISVLSHLQSRLTLSRYDSSKKYTALFLGCILRETFWDVNARL
jgi:hypothetical protein